MNTITKLRKEQNWTQAELAKILNVHQTAVSQWELGRTLPDILTAQKLALIFGVKIEELLNDNNYLENEKNYKDGEPTVDDIKFALFEGADNITDEMFDKVKAFAKFVQQEEAKKNDNK